MDEAVDEETVAQDEPENQPTVVVHRLSKGGRPTLYRQEFCEIAARMCGEGATDFEIAQAFEVHVATFYRWLHEHPEFRESMKLGKQAADERVERTLYHRAIGYSFNAVKVMQDKGAPVVVEYVEHVAPDPVAAKYWLNNRKPEEWRDRHELTGKDGGPIELEVTDSRERNLALIQSVADRVAGEAPAGSDRAGDEPPDSGTGT